MHFVSKIVNYCTKSPRSILVDSCSVFYTVFHCVLLHKLECFGCGISTMSSLKDYLSSRIKRPRLDYLSCSPLISIFGAAQDTIFSVSFHCLYAEDVIPCPSVSSAFDSVIRYILFRTFIPNSIFILVHLGGLKSTFILCC